MQEISPGIFVETAYPPYNVALIAGDHAAITVDWPLYRSQAEAWRRAAEDVAGPLRYAILTDAGPERQVAAARCGLPLIGSLAARRVLRAHDERTWREVLQEVAAQYPEEAADMYTRTPPRLALVFARELRLYRHTPTLHLETAVGAAPGALWVALPERQALLAGDCVTVGEPPPLGRAPDFTAWLAALIALENRPQVFHIVPGRGAASILKSDVAPQCEFLRALRHTAQRLAHGKPGQSYSRPAQDLGQMFFNRGGQKAIQCIRRGLERLVTEYQTTPGGDAE